MQNVLKSVAKHSAIYGIGDMLNRAISFFLLPLYTHYLSPKQYGILEMLDLTNYIIGMFLAMGISQSVVRFYHEYPDEGKKKLVLSTGAIAIWILSAAWLCGLLFATEEVSSLVFRTPEYHSMFAIIFVNLVLGLGNEIPMTYLRIKERSLVFICISFVRLLLTLSLNILFIVKYDMGPTGVLLGGTISSAAVSLLLVPYFLRQVGTGFSPALAWPMFKYGFPLIGNWVGLFAVHYGNRFVLQHLASLTDVGVYSLAYKFGMIPNMVILSPFWMIWSPKQFEVAKEPNAGEIFASIFTYFALVQTFFILCLSATVVDIIRIITDPAYHDAGRLVPILLASYFFFGAHSFTQFGLLYRKRTKVLGALTLALGGINVGLNWLLVPRFGLWGSTCITLATLFLLFAAVTFLAQRQYPIRYETGRLAKMALTALVLFGAAWTIDIPNIYLSLAAKAAVALLFPFALYLLRFYHPRELELARRFLGAARARLLPARPQPAANPGE